MKLRDPSTAEAHAKLLSGKALIEGAILDFGLTYEQQAVADVAVKLGNDLLGEAAREAQKAKAVPRRIWVKLAETGLLPAVPAEFGGGGVPDPLALCVAIEGLAHGDAAITASVVWSAFAALLIDNCGTRHQREHYLPFFASDPDVRGAVACYEGFGRAPSEYETRFERTKDGEWYITGRKVAVLHGTAANPLVVVGTDAAGHLRGAILSTDIAGIKVSSDATLIGLTAAPTATLHFDISVPEDNLLGGVNADPVALLRAMAQVRLSTASIALGCAQRASEYASAYAMERVAFGKPIAGFQGVAFMMADAEVQLNAARLELRHAVSRIDEIKIEDLEKLVGTTIAYVTGMAAKVTRDCVQVLGGHGFITDHPVERWYRAAGALCTLDFDVMRSAYVPTL